MRERGIDWRNQLVGLAVVFIGITAAFLLENWRERREERRLADAYRAGFVDDLGADARALKNALDQNRGKLERLESVVADLRQAPLGRAPAVATLGEMLSNQLFMPRQSTYEAMRNSGQLDLIEDLDQRRALVGYYVLLEETAFKETILNEYINDYVVPYVVDNLDMANQTLRPGVAPDDPRLRNLIVGYQLLLHQVVDAYGQIQARNGTLTADLRPGA